MNLERVILGIDGEQIVCEFSLREVNAIIIHGGGTSELSRFYKIAEAVYNRGAGVVLFNFSGHGESSGKLEDQSLERRRKQATDVIKQLVPEGKMYLLGFSMGAQALCDILPEFADRTEAMLLGCPAVYADSAHDLLFGNPKFTEILRTPGSWKQSRAYDNLRDYSGKTVIAIGTDDEVIPKGVVSLLRRAAQNLTYKEYFGASHLFASWLSNHPKQLTDLIANLV